MLTIAILCLSVLYLIYKYLTRNYDYWKKRNVPCDPPRLLFGNIPMGQNTSMNCFLSELYYKYPTSPYIGYYRLQTPSLLLTKPEYIEQVLVKDADFFWRNEIKLDPELDAIAERGPFFQVGHKWKKSRGFFTPLFSNAKLKHITPFLVRASKDMIEYIENKKTCEARDLLSRYVTDANALSAFGVEADSFQDDAFYRKFGLQITEPTRLLSLKLFCVVAFPPLAKLLRLKFIAEDTIVYVKQTIKTALKHRKENNITNNDFLDSIMALQSDSFDEIDVLSWCFGFFTDPNTGNQGSYILYSLAKNPEVQKKLKAEIDEVLKKHNGEITFEAIQEMNYLDCVISEVMRLHPSVPIVTKECTGYYEFPLEDGQERVVSLEPGMSIAVPIAEIQRDEKYFEKANEFIPERFAEGNKRKIQKGSYMPFGLGRRICAGMRFATVLMKISTVAIIKEFELRVNEKTVEPFDINPFAIMSIPKCGLWINFIKRK